MSPLTASETGSVGEVRKRVVNRIGFIELNRPQALNALSLPMIRAIRAALDEWLHTDVLAVVMHSPHPRAFCAGGDVRFFHEAYQRGQRDVCDVFFIEEYSLDHALFCYPKPCIALLNGIVMGGGMGISQPARQAGGLRLVTASTQMAMPETRIGFFPDVGASWFLRRAPGAIGRYLAVTGIVIDAADALYADLADAYLVEDILPVLEHAPFNTAADVLATVKRKVSQRPPVVSKLASARSWIDHHFRHSDIARILVSLECETDSEARPWAQQTIAVMRERSPLSMAISLRRLVDAPSSMAECLRRDLDLTRSMFERGDVLEGVRAHIVDKDNRPLWRVRRIEDLRSEDIASMFISPWTPSEHPLRDLAG